MINDNINMLSDNNFYREEDDAERHRADNDCKYSKNRDDLLFHVLPFLNKNTFPFRRNLSENEISRAIIAHSEKIINIFFRNVLKILCV